MFVAKKKIERVTKGSLNFLCEVEDAVTHIGCSIFTVRYFADRYDFGDLNFPSFQKAPNRRRIVCGIERLLKVVLFKRRSVLKRYAHYHRQRKNGFFTVLQDAHEFNEWTARCRLIADELNSARKVEDGTFGQERRTPFVSVNRGELFLAEEGLSIFQSIVTHICIGSVLIGYGYHFENLLGKIGFSKRFSIREARGE